MKSIFTLSLILLFHSITYGQNGYVKHVSNSTINGFIRQNRSIKTGELEIEVWLTKKDKNPKSYSLSELTEYAIKKDTFLILADFYPFEGKDLHFDFVPARIIESGKVDLFIISQSNYPTLSQVMGGGLIPALIDESLGNYNGPLFILRSKSKNLIGGVSNQKDEFVYSVNDYFKDNFNLMKKIINRDYKFKDLKTIVKEYNN